jgi:alpha-1,3-glucan synthase
LFYGEEQNFYLFDTGAANYLYGFVSCFPASVSLLTRRRRQAMTANTAWKRHGCYGLGSEQYFNFAVEKALIGCYDNWNALDHFDPTMDTRRMFARLLALRSAYPAIQDGFDLTQLGNWTYSIERPGSDGVPSEMGLWSVARAAIQGQKLNGSYTGPVWILYTNENATTTYTHDCHQQIGWMKTPFTSDVVVRNLFAPYENYTLTASGESFNNDGKAPFFGCLPTITVEGFGFKALVPAANWVDPAPALTKFTPGHDARIAVQATDTNATTMDITFEFNTAMDCGSVSSSMSFNLSSSNHGGQISVSKGTCGPVTSPTPARISGSDTSQFQWTATLTNFADGILAITLDNPSSAAGVKTGVHFISMSLSLRC